MNFLPRKYTAQAAAKVSTRNSSPDNPLEDRTAVRKDYPAEEVSLLSLSGTIKRLTNTLPKRFICGTIERLNFEVKRNDDKTQETRTREPADGKAAVRDGNRNRKTCNTNNTNQIEIGRIYFSFGLTL